MDQEKIGNLIKKIRKDNNMSQQDFAKKYGVTFQAVSKWENGINIPDISIVKQICNDYNLDINDFLDAKHHKKRNNFILVFIIIILVGLIIFFISRTPNGFEFKTITASCKDFKVSGSMAYSDKKSSIYISHVDYCGGDDTTEYEKIECDLMEESGNNLYLVEKCTNVGNNINLEEYLKDVQFNIDKYDKSCTRYAKNPLYLIIRATTKTGDIKDYSIPLELSDNCKAS